MKKCMQKCEYNTDEGCMASKLGATCNLSNTEGKTENEARPINKELVKLVKNVLLDVVRKVNSGQLVEVIRCKDCIGQSTWFKDAETGCEICGMSGMYPKGEFDFCSYGDRRKP